MDKTIMRNEVLSVLKEMDSLTYQTRSAQITQSLLNEEQILQSKIIGITISSFPEVDTWHLIEHLWSLGIRVAVPKCHAKTRDMQFYEITSFDQLEIVYMKLHEPKPEITNKINAEDISYLIVPGVVFDTLGFRVGFGGGYYDRFLQKYKGATISLAFDEQVVPTVPKEHHDLPVDIILTDQNKWICHAQRGKS
ncbi:5-formyltetrahydrofolate cyclo-ligase [Paenisporosarcina quisquiliarum]|uniref:5-formyltetrahydrofolate cyclo-ligase n=1 Tax=Paenisporosarcina quisquiliarum TaxID=365346 RepID=UPI003735C4E2